ncbi:MAG: HI0074 family nucleotidyltransferase substrate-binding subunit [Candidatus Muiribacteriota bacterium]
MTVDIRWKQRYDNFNKSFLLLKQSLDISNPDITQRAGIIQFFEVTFELGWKTLKDFLLENGFNNINSPRDTIKTAFNAEYIKEGHIWLEALKDRNLSTHTYEEEFASQIEKNIRENYFNIIKDLKEFFESNL